MRKVSLLLLLLMCFYGCSGGGSAGDPPTVDAGPVPGGPIVIDDGGGNPPPVAVNDPGNSLAAALNRSTPPGLPASPPPLVAGASPRSERALGATYNLVAGWNVLSFPFGRVTAASGFRYQLYGYSQGNFFAVDPVNNPGAIDTRLAYFAYSDGAVSVNVSGESNDGELSTVPLNQGWNLVGCPFESPIFFSTMSASQPGLTRRLEDAAGSWIDRTIYGLSPQGALVTDDLLGPSSFNPFEARWVYAFSDTELNLNPVPPSPPPILGNISSASAQAGDLLVLTGSGFGAPENGLVTIGGIPVPGTSLQSWSGSAIQLIVPPGVQSGSVVVFVNRYPSNPGIVTITNAGVGTASLSGLVQSSGGVPLSGAQVTLDSGQTAQTGADGTFSIADIPAGDHLVFAQALGYKRGAGLLSFAAGDQRSLLVELSPLTGGGSSGGSGSQQERGNLYIAVSPYFVGNTRYFVSRIEVQEYGNHANRWSDINSADFGDSEYDLTCDGAYIGRSYTIHIVWKSGSDEIASTFYRTFYQNGQTERFTTP